MIRKTAGTIPIRQRVSHNVGMIRQRARLAVLGGRASHKRGNDSKFRLGGQEIPFVHPINVGMIRFDAVYTYYINGTSHKRGNDAPGVLI